MLSGFWLVEMGRFSFLVPAGILALVKQIS
jgi:hypothetical protein